METIDQESSHKDLNLVQMLVNYKSNKRKIQFNQYN